MYYKKKKLVVLGALFFNLHLFSLEAAPATVGKLKLTIPDLEPDHTTHLYIYYPLAKPERRFNDIFSPRQWYKRIISVWKSPPVSLRTLGDLSIADTKHPLILYSHGYMGDPQELSWLFDYLVSQGYIVAAVEHTGSAFKTFDLHTSVQPWKQAQRNSQVIDYLQSSPLAQYINFDAIGYLGYSKGGMVGLWLAGGMTPDLSIDKIINDKIFHSPMIPDFLKVQVDELVANTDQIPMHESHRDFSDSRIKSFFLIAPAFANVFNVRCITKPVAIIAPESDELIDHSVHAERVAKHNKRIHFSYIGPQSSGHFIFLPQPTLLGKLVLPKILYQDAPDVDRSKIQREVEQLIQTFFARTLSHA